MLYRVFSQFGSDFSKREPGRNLMETNLGLFWFDFVLPELPRPPQASWAEKSYRGEILSELTVFDAQQWRPRRSKEVHRSPRADLKTCSVIGSPVP